MRTAWKYSTPTWRNRMDSYHVSIKQINDDSLILWSHINPKSCAMLFSIKASICLTLRAQLNNWLSWLTFNPITFCKIKNWKILTRLKSNNLSPLIYLSDEIVFVCSDCPAAWTCWTWSMFFSASNSIRGKKIHSPRLLTELRWSSDPYNDVQSHSRSSTASKSSLLSTEYLRQLPVPPVLLRLRPGSQSVLRSCSFTQLLRRSQQCRNTW